MQDLLTPPEHSEEIVRLVPGAEHVVVNDAGHIIMLEHPEVITGCSSSLVERGLRAPRRGHRRRAQAAGAAHRHRPREAPDGSPGPGAGGGTRRREASGAWPLPTAEDTRASGARLGAVLRAGDLVVLTGDLGAGKTTLTQGIAEGLGVRGAGHLARPSSSPGCTRRWSAGPALVHVDAYRLGGLAELDDLDLDASLEDSVTVVEWGTGWPRAWPRTASRSPCAGDDERRGTDRRAREPSLGRRAGPGRARHARRE